MADPVAEKERGKHELLALVLLSVVMFALLALQTWRTGHSPGLRYPGALIAASALGLLTFKRRRWARTLLVVLAGVAAAAVTLAALQGFYYSPIGAAALLLGAALFAGIAWRLQTSHYINAFLTA